MMLPEFLQYGYIFGSFKYWAWLGTIYLIILTWQDHRKAKMLVDDRLNFFVMGTTFSLLSHVFRPLWYVVVLFFLVLFLCYYLNRFRILGKGDAHSLVWIFYGCGILGVEHFLGFAVIFSIIAGLYYFIKLVVFRYKLPTPFYIVILLSFFLNGLLGGLY